MTKNILETSHLIKDFRPAASFSEWAKFNFTPPAPTRAMNDLSFSLERGKILGILGPNGAGKTTLLKTIATLILPTSGTLSFFNAGPTAITWTSQGLTNEQTEWQLKSSIGLTIDEERSFYWRLSGHQNLEFFSALYGLDAAATSKRINELFSLFGIDYGAKRFDSYSSGMKKCFSLIRALLHNPSLLLLDEPTKSLDYATAARLKEFIKTKLVQADGKTVIFTTHNLNENLDFCDLFMILRQGQVAAFGSLAHLRQQISNPAATIADIFLHFTREA